MSSTKKFLQRAVSNQVLRGVLVDYEALCSSTVHVAAPTEVAHATTDAPLGDGAAPLHQPTMFQNMRSLLQNMTKADTEHGRRVQQTLAGLPHFMRDRVLGGDDKPGAGEETTSIEEQLQRKAKPVVDVLATEDSADGPRAKYLEKMNALKQRAKLNALKQETTVAPVADDSAGVEVSAASVLPTRKVNEGANAFLSYVNLRGLALCVIPPLAEHRQAEFQQFIDEFELDAVMGFEAAIAMPRPDGIQTLCKELNLEPKGIVVVTSAENAIASAKAAGSFTCFLATKTRDSHYDCDFSIPNLREFKYVVEDLNGISWRN
ncbi:hypothetical protein SPRG_04052 [Saprolegnia parasitica CBS 223.65]|uniref:Uncharacterized protein n=1 Tax=Saprolegnia parasitica (strain CBS 223.65) TaxID=695850 RepID=A0A067CXA5_SAPPC|nr:hypothetical protein SPRG_04052 [Saprolegnia parasitica CBS 223.65]KDO31437.1 hypothetical protein SPRG_04052 [Saprolegnia parasitica CBS 223.65]|eukprot:XP_012198032.1 hypothetical protein SPRG_04052 [Saprolegnia parasitica CBS 223.65]